MKRRSFLQLIGAGTLAACSPNMQAVSSAKSSMALQLYSVRDAVAKNLEGTLDRLRKIGYNGMELYGYNGTFFGHSVADFKNMLQRTGFSVISSHHTTGIAMKGPGTLTDGWEKAVEDLHSVGASYMACSYLFPNERTKEIYTSLPDLLTTSGAVAKKAGMQFAYHNHDFEFEKFNDTLVYDYLINSTTPDTVQMELDLYWITKAGHDPVAYFSKYPGRFPLWHVKDMEAKTGDITEVGHGVIDFARIFAAKKQAGLKQWFVEQDVSKGDMFESLTFSHNYLNKQQYI